MLDGEIARRMRQLAWQAEAVDAEGARPSLAIEADWRAWLRSVAPRTFTGSFAPFHAAFWDWFWSITGKRRNGEPPGDEDHAFLAIWARGMGKSSNVEWAAIAEGALVGRGYVLYVSGTQALAEGHVQAIRERIESEDVARHYPHLANPKVGKHGNQNGWRQDFLQTANGWAIRPLGLDVGVRGGRVGDLRPTLIIFDDVDDHTDSPLVIQKKLDTIARSIIPAGARDTVILGAQNLIHRNSVFNQILTRRTSVLSRRIVSGPYPAFDGLEIEPRVTPAGTRNAIVAGRPTWPDMDLDACQKFLDDSGRESFLAEYQHDFSAIEQGRVLPEYDEAVHVITWSDFARVYGKAAIPKHWRRDCGHDVGFTEGHISAWTWITTAAANSRMPGLRFRYRGMTFTEPLLDEMAEAAIARMADEGETVEDVTRWRMSHEAKSERGMYRAKFGLPFIACQSAKTAGLSQWRHYLRVDRSKPHPFKEDERGPDGRYRLGCPGLFDVVADDQLLEPRDDYGLATHRRQAASWRYAPDRLSITGMPETLPMKADEDSCFVAGTVITTSRGGVPIEDVRAGDVALTRQGWRNINASRKTSDCATILSVKFSNRAELRGTGNHPVWVTGRGWTRLDSLKIGDVVWHEPKLLFSTASSSTDTPTRSNGRIAPTSSRTLETPSGALRRFTLRYGGRLMAMCLRAITSTIETKTRLTTTLATWNACRIRHTLPCTDGRERKPSGRIWQRFLVARGPWQRSGIGQTRGESGIESMPRFQFSRGPNWHGLASIAGLNIGPSNLTPAFALPGASSASGTACRSTLLRGIADIAGRFSSVGREAKSSIATESARDGNSLAWCRAMVRAFKGAWSAEHLSSLLAPQNTAPVVVTSAPRIVGVAPVYNLSVDGEPEYFANGVLVHNCDSTRMITAEWGPSETPYTEREQEELALPETLRAEAVLELPPERFDFALIKRDYELAKVKKERETRRSHWASDICDPNSDPWSKIKGEWTG